MPHGISPYVATGNAIEHDNDYTAVRHSGLSYRAARVINATQKGQTVSERVNPDSVPLYANSHTGNRLQPQDREPTSRQNTAVDMNLWAVIRTCIIIPRVPYYVSDAHSEPPILPLRNAVDLLLTVKQRYSKHISQISTY